MMNSRLAKNFGRRQTTALALLLLAVKLGAAPVRVTSWDLQPNSAAGTNAFKAEYQSNLISEAAVTLRKLNPDVILLQEVRDWESCDRLAKALKPANYTVAVCSSFRDPRTGKLSRGQVAILSKTRALISWSDAWEQTPEKHAAPGGFAFAAIKVDNKNVGFFSVQMGDGSFFDFQKESRPPEERARDESMRQLLEQVQTVRNWSANRLQAQVAAGEFNTSADDQAFGEEKTLQRLRQSGFDSAFDGLEPAKRVTLPGNANRPDATTDYIFTRDVGGALNPQIYEASLTEHWVLTSDLDLDAEKPQPAPVAPAIAEAPPVKTNETFVAQNAQSNTVPKEPVPAKQTNEAAAAKSVPGASAPAVAGATPPMANNNPAPDKQAPIEPDTGRDGALRRARTSQRDVPTLQPQLNWRFIGTCAGGVIALFLSGLLLGTRLRRKKSKALLPAPRTGVRAVPIVGPERIVVVPTTTNQAPFVRIEVEGVTQTQTQSQSQTWQSQPETSQPHVAQISGPLREGLIRQLSHWLKSKFVQRMISDRAELMKTQQTAALKVLAMDERLSKVERQIQERNREYEQRIDALLKELEVAREENRELIRAKIAVLRAEMEKNARSAPAKPKD